METSLTDFRSEFLDRLLELLWQQWTAVGVSGHGRVWRHSVIDPEALLLISCTLGRRDARLFDAMVEWVRINSRFINVQRAKRMLRDESFAGGGVLRAVAAAAKTSTHEGKWRGITRDRSEGQAEREDLFFLKDGPAHPVVGSEDPQFADYGFRRNRFDTRGAARIFRPEPLSNLMLRLRALLGVNARCEILLFLLLNDQGSPRAMGRDCYYFPATMSKALAEMNGSGYVISRVEGRHRYYRLVPEIWKELFLGEVQRPRWIVWARLFSALEQIWLFLSREDLAGRSALVQASSLRRVLKRSVLSQLDRCGLPLVFGDESAHLGEALIPFFVERTRAVLASVESLGK